MRMTSWSFRVLFPEVALLRFSSRCCAVSVRSVAASFWIPRGLPWLSAQRGPMSSSPITWSFSTLRVRPPSKRAHVPLSSRDRAGCVYREAKREWTSFLAKAIGTPRPELSFRAIPPVPAMPALHPLLARLLRLGMTLSQRFLLPLPRPSQPLRPR